METIKELSYKGFKILVVKDIWGQEFTMIPDLYPSIGFASISDAKREIDGKQRKWSICVL